MAIVRGFEGKALLFLGLALLSCVANGALLRGLPLLGPAVFDVTKFGARPNGRSESAQAFMRAWNAACRSTGAATVLIPPGRYMTGEVYFQGPCSRTTSITIDVQGTVLAQPDLSEFTGSQWFLIHQVNGLVIKGTGTFNGQGEAVWQYDACGNQPTCDSPLPTSLAFEEVNNSIVQGINLVNSKGFHIKISDSHSFEVQKVSISAPADSPHTNGVHIVQSDFVTVSNSTIQTGGDCVSTGLGATRVSVSGNDCQAGHRH